MIVKVLCSRIGSLITLYQIIYRILTGYSRFKYHIFVIWQM